MLKDITASGPSSSEAKVELAASGTGLLTVAKRVKVTSGESVTDSPLLIIMCPLTGLVFGCTVVVVTPGMLVVAAGVVVVAGMVVVAAAVVVVEATEVVVVGAVVVVETAEVVVVGSVVVVEATEVVVVEITLVVVVVSGV